MKGEEIYYCVKRKDRKELNIEIENKGLSFGDLRVTGAGVYPIFFEASCVKAKSVDVQTLEEVVKECVSKNKGLCLEMSRDDSISVWRLFEDIRFAFFGISIIKSPLVAFVEFRAHEKDAVQLAVDVAEKLGLEVEAEPHFCYENKVLRGVVKEALHAERWGRHFFQFTYEPGLVERAVVKSYTECFDFENADGTRTAVISSIDPGIASDEIFRINNRRVRFKNVKGLGLERIRTKGHCNEKYFDLVGTFVAEDQKQDFEYLRMFFLQDQELPLMIDNIGDARRKLEVIKMLEKIVQNKPHLKDYAEKCGVYC